MVASSKSELDFSPELTIKDAAEALGVSQKTVRRYLAEGSLIARNAAPLSGGRAMWRIPLEAVQALRGAYDVQGTTRPAVAFSRRVARYEPKHFKMIRT